MGGDYYKLPGMLALFKGDHPHVADDKVHIETGGLKGRL